jgi:hypothetical protein
MKDLPKAAHDKIRQQNKKQKYADEEDKDAHYPTLASPTPTITAAAAIIAAKHMPAAAVSVIRNTVIASSIKVR